MTFRIALCSVVFAAAGCAASDGATDEREGQASPTDCELTLSPFAGDCHRLAPPEPGVGFQAHYGPEDYDDPDALEPFVLYPGGEEIDCMYRTVPAEVTDDGDLFYSRYRMTTRPGMHHVILYGRPGDAADEGRRDGCDMRGGARLLAVLQGGISGGSYENPPPDETPAPENARLATRIDAGETIVYELHAVNPTDEPLLRESWTNFIEKPKDEVDTVLGRMAFNGGIGMEVQPHTREVVRVSCDVPDWSVESLRVVDLFGHMHSHGTRFTAWAVQQDPGGDGSEERTLIYESYTWSELDLIRFNSTQENPEPDRSIGRMGGYSGILTLRPGDRIEYECEIDNDEDYVLVYGVGAFTAEMCNLFGSYAPENASAWYCIGL